MPADFLAPVANHLWQSTIFGVGAALLTLALRKHRAAIRYWIWLAASVKFLVPFSALTNLGAALKITRTAVVAPNVQATVEQVTQPFTYTGGGIAATVPAATELWPALVAGIWLLGCVWLFGVYLARWRRVQRAVHAAKPFEMDAPVPVVSVSASMEPGVFGMVRPILLLPEGIAERLSKEQLDTVLAHELCHIRRGDNLAAALHMLVEALFWFHPLVWWVGARLIEERERACDEDVISRGGRPEIYAESILNVCKHYVELPLTCMSGVTGADLKKRITEIMESPARRGLTPARKCLLGAAGFAALALPLIAGMLKQAPLSAQSAKADQIRFDVASIRPSEKDQLNSRLGPIPGGGLQAKNVTLENLITFAYNIRDFQLGGGPNWVKSDRFDILAKPELPDGPTELKGMTPEQHGQLIEHLRQRTRLLLAERFQLIVRQGTKELPVFALVASKSGHKLKPTTGKNQHMRTGRMQIQADGSTMEMLAESLSMILGRKVLNRTSLSGGYDFQLNWTRDTGPSLPGNLRDPNEPEPADASGSVSIFTALEDQLGLKLESAKGPVLSIVIDRAEKPTEN